MKAFYDVQPEKFSDNKNGSVTYRWGIEVVEIVRNMGGEETTETKWTADEVIVYNPVTRAKIVETVISAVWGVNMEAKLLNDYNSALNGLLESEYQANYLTFLTERKALKELINEDCAEMGIV